jgi:hypothetical protein
VQADGGRDDGMDVLFPVTIAKAFRRIMSVLRQAG